MSMPIELKIGDRVNIKEYRKGVVLGITFDINDDAPEQYIMPVLWDDSWLLDTVECACWYERHRVWHGGVDGQAHR